MNICPKTSDAWGRLLLFPFKVYVFIGLITFILKPDSRKTDTADFRLFVDGYVICFCVLLFGGLVQAAFGRRKDAAVTLAVAVFAFLVGTRFAGSFAR